MTNCLEVALPYSRSAAVYRVHRIVGRSRRHGTARHVALKRLLAELDGCRKPSGNIVTSVRQAALKSVSAVAAIASLVAGSGIIGGFGPMRAFDSMPGCLRAGCGPAVLLQEPFSAGLLGIAALLVIFVRRASVI